jgi:TRAP-type C4-dicarboxylate transport system permease large subunit
LSTYGYFLALVAVGLTAWQLIALSVEYFQTCHTNVSETLGLPLFPFMMALAIGMAVLAVVLLKDFLYSLRSIENRHALLVTAILFAGSITLTWMLFFGLNFGRTTAGLISILLLLLFLFMAIPVGYVLILVGFSGSVWIAGIKPALVSLALVSFENTNSFEFAVIPLFILMVVGGFIYMRFMAITRIPFEDSEYIIGLGLPKYLILTIVIVAYIIMGMFFDIFSMLILTVPLVFPMIMALGFDPIWYGVIMVKVAEIGCITAPFGMNLFGLSAAVDAPMGVVFQSIYPFFGIQLVNILILVAFPAINTFLPALM